MMLFPTIYGAAVWTMELESALLMNWTPEAKK